MEVFIKFMEEPRKKRQFKRFKTLVFQRQLELSNVRISRVVSRRRLFAKSKCQDSFNTIPLWWENENGQVTNWLDLPEDITLQILNRVGVVDNLRNTPMVCTAWRDLSNPFLFTRILIPRPLQYFNSYKEFDNFMMKVVHKSSGQLIEFCAMEYVGYYLLEAVSLQGHTLRYLKVDGMSYSYLQYFAKSFSQLEHLDLCDILDDLEVVHTIRIIGCSSPNLKHLRLHSVCNSIIDQSRVNDVAFAIAKYAPRLHNIRIFNNKVSNEGLQAILEGCPELEYICLQKCPYINIRDTDCLRDWSVLRNKIIDARVYNEAKGNFECYLWTKDQC